MAASDGALAVGPERTLVLWNAAAEAILGYAAREVLGRTCCDTFAGAGDGQCLCSLRARAADLAAGAPVASFDMPVRTKDGRRAWVNLTSPTRDDLGGLPTVHLFRDVTEARTLLERLAQGAPEVPDVCAGLTKREVEILRLVAEGLSTKALAAFLRISPNTVRNHVQNILAKLKVHNRIQAVAYGNAHRILDPVHARPERSRYRRPDNPDGVP